MSPAIEDFTNQKHTPDQLKQVEFLNKTLTRYIENQNEQYKALTTKMTFLFGFVVTVLTFYGNYATNINSFIRDLALIFFAGVVFLLCLAFQNRTFYDPPILDTSVKKSNYFSKVYQDVANLKEVCRKNNAPLKNMEKYIDRAIWVFTTGVVLLALSFVFHTQPMVNSVYGHHHFQYRTRGAATSETRTS